MAEHIRRASFWTVNSFYLLSNKIIAFLFASFCVVTGQVKESSLKQMREVESIKVKGKVYNSQDSSVIENIKIVISGLKYTDSWYGFFDAPIIDTTGADGSYEISIPNNLSISNGDMEAVDIDSDINGLFSDTKFDISLGNVDNDTIINIYLNPDGVFNSLKENNSDGLPLIEFEHSNCVIIKLRDYKTNNCEVFTKIFNSSGRLVDEIIIPKSGIIKWSIEEVSKGAYFLKIPNKKSLQTIKLNIK